MDVDGPIINITTGYCAVSPTPNPLHCFQAPCQPQDALLLTTRAVNETYNIKIITTFLEVLSSAVAFIVHRRL